jgi:DNA-directed RNA polymerase subunit RPC12/RpoP
MATTIKVTCPKCKKGFQAPDTVKGKKVRCKSCNEVFTVGAKQDEEWGVIASYAVGSLKDVPRCPFCAHDLEEEEQVICLNCGYNLLTRERHSTQVIHEVTGSDRFIWLLPGILCLLVALLFLTCVAFMWVPIDLGDVWKDWVQNTEFTKIYLSVICAFIIFYCGRFAVKRLVMHPQPPDREKIATTEGND